VTVRTAGKIILFAGVALVVVVGAALPALS
jgi:hypothetical protein